jgi:signal transduction histidine kinase
VASLGFISLYERDNNKLILKASYPPRLFSKLKESIGEIDLLNGHRGGIVGRAAMTKNTNLTSDVRVDPDYINLDAGTRSELAVPIIVGDEVIGVINVEHQEINAFDQEDMQIIKALADQAGIAIQNARRYEEIQRTKGLIGARTALAWMGMVSSTWMHSIRGKAVNIRNIAALMRMDLKTKVDLDDIDSELEMIDRLASDILERPITPPLASEEGSRTFDINELLETRVQRLREDISKSDIITDLKLEANKPMLVSASPEWIRRGVDLLIDNSIRAMASSSTKLLTISSSVVGEQIEILIRDTGKGISSELKSKLFTEPIAKKKGEKGFGMGLLMAQAIFQAYGGNVELVRSNPSGTTFAINLPKQTGTP